MTAVEAVLEQIAKLSPEDRAKVREKMDGETRTMTIYTLSSDEMRKALDVFEPVRKQAESMTEEEVNEAIDQAIAEVRAERRTRVASE